MSIITLSSTSSFSANNEPVAHWKFDEGKGQRAIDSATGQRNRILGNFRYTPGVLGAAVKFDGFTTHIIRNAEDAPRLNDALTIEAWGTPQAYPWSWCAVVNQEKNHKAGYELQYESCYGKR